MKKSLCLIVLLISLGNSLALAQRGPAVAPIIEISAEDNSPVPPSEAVAFDFTNNREIASIPAQQESLLPLVALFVSLPLFIWFSVMMRLGRELKKHDELWENLASFPRTKAPSTATPINPDEDVEDQYKKAS